MSEGRESTVIETFRCPECDTQYQCAFKPGTHTLVCDECQAEFELVVVPLQ